MLLNLIKGNHKFIHRRHYATIGIRREDKSRWERRTPLTPDHVKKLIQETGTQVYVQPSTKRIFPIESYEKVSSCEYTWQQRKVTDLAARLVL
jgi:alpha-aminoadipic semialdehyde synthase